jgi:hypothetical protein
VRAHPQVQAQLEAIATKELIQQNFAHPAIVLDLEPTAPLGMAKNYSREPLFPLPTLILSCSDHGKPSRDVADTGKKYVKPISIYHPYLWLLWMVNLALSVPDTAVTIIAHLQNLQLRNGIECKDKVAPMS